MNQLHVLYGLRVSYGTLNLLANDGDFEAHDALKKWQRISFFEPFVGCKWTEDKGFCIGYSQY